MLGPGDQVWPGDVTEGVGTAEGLEGPAMDKKPG